jgi:protocatechuate 3,4-dioxygenase, alpha subunit
VTFAPTPGQTVGPFFGFALPYAGGPDLVDRSHRSASRLHGTVYDGAGDPVPDALIEIWQADEHGHLPAVAGSLQRDGYTFTGFGRTATDPAGHYQFTTVEPGLRKEGAGRVFIAVVIFARGLLHKLHTRIYLPEHGHLVAVDPVLAPLGAARLATLVATREAERVLRHDIHLQGEAETVFLAYERRSRGPANR